MRRLLWALLLALPCLAHAGEKKGAAGQQGKRLFETICGACHALDLPKSQRLDRNNWRWVLEDMVEKYKCPMTPEQQALILDYLVKHYGPESP